MKPKISVDVNITRPTEIKIEADPQDALRIAANLSRSELAQVTMDTTGAGLMFFYQLVDAGVDVIGFNPGGK